MRMTICSVFNRQFLKNVANRLTFLGVVVGLAAVVPGSGIGAPPASAADPTCPPTSAAGSVTSAKAAPVAAGQVWERDPKAEQEVLEASHQLHVAFDNRDVKAVADQIADDDFLFVFELTPESKPVKLKSKQELVDWLKTSFVHFDNENDKTEAKNPVMTARATSNYAVVTEECSLKVIRPDGSVQLQTLRATSVARKGADGWKWIHWHMSAGAPRMVFSKGQPVELPQSSTAAN